MSKDLRSTGFDRILERLAGGGPDDAAAAGQLPQYRALGQLRVTVHLIHDELPPGGQADDGGGTIASGRLNQFYTDQDIAEADGAVPLSSRARSCDPQIVTGELGLEVPYTRAELGRIRRQFARAHHPDKARPCDRAQASRRMATANMLIDEACKRLRRP